MHFKTLFSHIIGDVPGCPNPVIISSIRESARRLFTESTVWREAAVLAFTGGVYTISPPVGSQIVTVISPINVEGNDTQGYGKEYAAVRVRTRSPFFVMQTDNSFALYSRFNEPINDEKEIIAYIALRPNRIATEIPDDIGERWFDVLADGAKWLLMVMPNYPWSNPELAAYYKQKFDEGIQAAKSYIETGYRQTMSDGKRHVKGYFK